MSVLNTLPACCIVKIRLSWSLSIFIFKHHTRERRERVGIIKSAGLLASSSCVAMST